ncbi:Rv1733c family protein [Streptomyces sp. NBC_01304]|uniref:Rv1733c family protein n=1 Tax=Streptomyces sp. NBC_01304 TaxID=2903818 RepID=UPI002E13B044|nr:hypothetical protein OG430_45245 [Streptomyces sp. NBC_01304]
MRALARLWRWRHNPLCRRTDLVEAWVALAAAALIAVAAPLVGLATGARTQDALQQAVRDQHAERHQVRATVQRALPHHPVDSDPETSSEHDGRVRVVANWTAPDGSRHSGTVAAHLRGAESGDRFVLWTDAHGRVVARPLDSATAGTHAALAGIGAAVAAMAFVECARRTVVRRMVRGRFAEWDREWADVGPDWGRTGTGS